MCDNYEEPWLRSGRRRSTSKDLPIHATSTIGSTSACRRHSTGSIPSQVASVPQERVLSSSFTMLPAEGLGTVFCGESASGGASVLPVTILEDRLSTSGCVVTGVPSPGSRPLQGEDGLLEHGPRRSVPHSWPSAACGAAGKTGVGGGAQIHAGQLSLAQSPPGRDLLSVRSARADFRTQDAQTSYHLRNLSYSTGVMRASSSFTPVAASSDPRLELTTPMMVGTGCTEGQTTSSIERAVQDQRTAVESCMIIWASEKCQRLLQCPQALQVPWGGVV